MTDKQASKPVQPDGHTFQLHQEELEITKKWVETADVKIHMKTYTEQRQITVPVTREELIIEKKIKAQNGGADQPIEPIIRIPISEERIEVNKYPVILEDVEIYKKQFKELVHIHETIKKEKLRVDTIGDIIVQENENQ